MKNHLLQTPLLILVLIHILLLQLKDTTLSTYALIGYLIILGLLIIIILKNHFKTLFIYLKIFLVAFFFAAIASSILFIIGSILLALFA